ncbi:MAG: dTDP-4-dehydrorhamnose 3,5-epimerase family protein [bacterium]
MFDDVIIKELKKNDDDRGWLTEIFRIDETELKPEMGYVSITKPSVVRGPHEHKNQSDFFVFLGRGKFRLYLWENRKGKENFRELKTYEVGEGNPVSVIVPPGVVHGYKCVSEEPGLVINLPNKLYKGEGKKDEVDEIRWETDKNSPFIID